ncbi:DNA-binding LacI/PurR family transcriptional regulator [Friedmanniella endophytica]|uniref:DNA-binding LacI/PurR family transcriptional regulator n=1 Tax=Microlunatus kandeliicorticis TaxID=1759536 RepID=A0A7W3IUC0_9ACTN|nr:LacI family DNA-binding transcriptional regulator [Microlunatus kandeliicorticis]MBA8795393.1 DNA-binding LacI/PurR family transcriptional regulator [Microlunatus kandeliicorticis]
MVTMQDVANRAGVSLKTVSNVVNGFPSIRPSTRERVERALADLGYRPNMAARSLAGGRTGLLALMIPDIDSTYYGRLTSHLIRAARAEDLTVMIQQAGRTVPGELETLGSLRRHFVDGMIGNTMALKDRPIRERMGPLPLVMMGIRWDDEDRVFDHVHIDAEGAGADGIEHLLGLGRSRIALLGRREPAIAPTDTRLRGVESALAAKGLRGIYGRVGTYSRPHGYQAMTQLLADDPEIDAVFCFNDDLAVGAMAAIQDAGKRVPEDVAVLGFDDTAMAKFTNPSLSSIHFDMTLLAGEAVRLLVAAIRRQSDGETEGYEPQDVVIPHTLRVRGSTVAGADRGLDQPDENEGAEIELDSYLREHPDWREDLAADDQARGRDHS